MTEPIYRLDLTERERQVMAMLVRCRYDELGRVLVEFGAIAPETSRVRQDYALLSERLASLEPVVPPVPTEGA